MLWLLFRDRIPGLAWTANLSSDAIILFMINVKMIDCWRRYEDSSAFFLEGVWGVADATSTCLGSLLLFFSVYISFVCRRFFSFCL